MAVKWSTKNSGITVWDLLFILFVGLKLTDVVDWSWVWVAAPFWIPLVITVLISAKYGE